MGAALLGKKEGYNILLMDEGSLKDGYRKELQQAGIEFIENAIDEEVDRGGMLKRHLAQVDQLGGLITHDLQPEQSLAVRIRHHLQ